MVKVDSKQIEVKSMRPQTQFDTSILDDFSRSCTVHFWPILHIWLRYYITIVAVSKKKKLERDLSEIAYDVSEMSHDT